MPIKHKLASIFIYLITAMYFVVSLYLLIFIGTDESLGWIQVLSEAWQTPEYNEVFKIGIASICIDLLVALLLFTFIGRTNNTNYCLATIVWALALAAWYFTPGLLINYVLGAVLVTVFSVQQLTNSGTGISTWCWSFAVSDTCRHRMPKVIYANIVWFLVVMASAIGASISRHESTEWDKMAEIRMNYDVLFVGVFGCYCMVSIIGLIRRKQWGYSSAMGFNYVITALSIVPVIGLVLVSLFNGDPLLEVLEAYLGVTLSGLTLGVVSLVFIVLMRRQHVKSAF